MKQRELDDLCDSFIEGSLSATQAARLSELLEHSAEARTHYWQLTSIHGLLEGVLQQEWLTPPAEKAPSRVRSSLARLRHIAAGIALGGLAVGAVWAYAAPLRESFTELKVTDPSFELQQVSQGPPTALHSYWTADPSTVVQAIGHVQPRTGSHMLQFQSASSSGDFIGSKNMASDLWQVIPLHGSGPRTVRVRAWFNAETLKQARFHIAAVAGDDSTTDAKELWESRYHEAGTLAFARSMTFVDQDPATWEHGELTLQVPPQARILVIGIAAYRLPVVPAHEWFPAQFVDDVSISITDSMLP